MGVASGPSEGGRFGAPTLDLRTLVRQGAALLLAAALVLVMLPSFSSSARASGLRLYLHNFPTPPTGNTPAGRALGMDGAAPTAATLYQYSTDHFNGRSGRYVHRSTTSGPAEADLLYMINWVYQVPEAIVLDGTATGGIWLSQKDGCAQTGQFHLWLRTKSDRMSDAGTLIGSGAGAVPPSEGSPPCGWGLIGVSMPVSATIPAGTWIELKLTVRDADRDAAMVAYDTTSFASYLDLPVGVATPTPEPPTPTPTPEPATPTPEPATPTPEPETPTPEPATPTPEPETPTPDPATPTPDPATPTPTAPPPTPTPTPDPPTPTPPPPPTPTPDPPTPTPDPPTPTPDPPTPTPDPPTPTPDPPTPDPPTPTPPPPTEPPTPTPVETWIPTPPPPPTPPPTDPPPTPTPVVTPTPTPPPTPDPIPSFLPPLSPHEPPLPLGNLETPPPPPPPSVPPQTPAPVPATARPGTGPLAPVATPNPRPELGGQITADPAERDAATPWDDSEPPRQLVDLTGGGGVEPTERDDARPSVLAATISKLARTAGEAVKTFAFPLSLTILVLVFLLIQGEIDRRDPKLAFAPVDSSKDMVYFE